VHDEQLVDLFLCHASPDKDWVVELAEQLESETFDGQPSGRLLRVYVDKWDIDKGENFLDRMEYGLGVARYVGVVLSPSLLNAPYAKLEWQHVLAEDPTNRRRRLLPLLYMDADPDSGERIALPAPFRVLNWIDFRGRPRFVPGVRELVRCLRDQPPERGRRRQPVAGLPRPDVSSPINTALPVGPDAVPEVILSNLFPVDDYPRTVWNAETTARTPQDIFALVESPPAFELKEKRLYTFCDLTSSASPFSALIRPDSIASDPTQTWLSDRDRSRWLVSLFNRCIRGHLGRMPIRYAHEVRSFFFLPDKAGADRVWKNGQDAQRRVAAKKTRPNSDLTFWIHHAANIQARLIGAQIYFLIEPTYGFSIDGQTLAKAEWVGSLKRSWSGKERNAAILRHILFWGRTLARGRSVIRMDTGALPIVVKPIPGLATTRFGLLDDQIKMRSLLQEEDDELQEAAELVEFDDDPS